MKSHEAKLWRFEQTGLMPEHIYKNISVAMWLQDWAPVRVTSSQHPNPQGPSLFLKGHLSSCTDFSKRTDMLQTQNPLSTDLKHCTNRSSIMRSKSHEQHSRTNFTCQSVTLRPEYQACALLRRREQGVACNLSYSLISFWSSLS